MVLLQPLPEMLMLLFPQLQMLPLLMLLLLLLRALL
jgi:hypothetical protein